MATPTNLPATFVAGDVLTAAQQNNLRGAFRTLQVVAASYDVQTGSASATYVTTGLSATLTPQASTNNVLINFSIPIGLDTSATNICGIRLVQTVGGVTTTIKTWDYAYGSGNGSVSTYSNFSNTVLVATGTTGARTYTVQFARAQGAGNAYVQAAGQSSNIILQEISA
jgi:hypothetical protein